ncbi:MAG: PIG-L family deacetylase [Phycisphaeraceae bacterium]|nr:PIG-L family deacetylase [Phycisphaeraceae bacterium]
MANILIIAAHPDDAEIGMGGTIARLASQGHNILIADLTDGSPTPRGDRDSRLLEAQHALAALNSAAARGGRVQRLLLNFPNRRLEHTLDTRHALAGVIRAHQANILFVPHWEDAHPDHTAATRIAEDARFDAKLTRADMPPPPGYTSIGPPIYPAWLWYYDISHLRRVAKPDFCFDITGFERIKQDAVRAYRSQFGPWDDQPQPPNHGALVNESFPERLIAYAAYFGSRIGVAFAEPFFSREPLGLTGLGCVTRADGV